MTGILEELERDHANISRVKRLAMHELDALESGQEADYSLLEEIMRYITSYSDAHHHPTEDILYEALKSSSPAAAARVEAVVGEHEPLIEKGRALLEAIEAVEEGAIVRRDVIVATGRDYFNALGRHMGVEERELFPMAARELPPDAWAELDARVERAPDPLFGPAIDEGFRRLWQRIEAHSG